jgi:hypothetical protein
VLSVLHRDTDSDYPFCIFKLFLKQISVAFHEMQKMVKYKFVDVKSNQSMRNSYKGHR